MKSTQVQEDCIREYQILSCVLAMSNTLGDSIKVAVGRLVILGETFLPLDGCFPPRLDPTSGNGTYQTAELVSRKQACKLVWIQRFAGSIIRGSLTPHQFDKVLDGVTVVDN